MVTIEGCVVGNLSVMDGTIAITGRSNGGAMTIAIGKSAETVARVRIGFSTWQLARREPDGKLSEPLFDTRNLKDDASPSATV